MKKKKKHLGEQRRSLEIKTKEYDTQLLTKKIWGKRKIKTNLQRLRPRLLRLLLLVYHVL